MILVLTIATLATQYLCWPWWVPLAACWGYWALMLPLLTWRDYLAAMNYWRLARGGLQALVEGELGNEPGADFVARKLLLPGALLHDVFVNVTWATLYFRELPKELLLTVRLNRYVKGPHCENRDKALRLRKDWLNRYDPRGIHT